MKILFAGTTVQAAEVLRHLCSSIHQVVGVLTREDAPIGRKSIMTPSPVALLAATLDIPLLKSNRADPDVAASLRDLKADLGIVIAYGSLLNSDMLRTTNKGWLNLHYSLLPTWRGAAPVQHAILNGDKKTGVSIFKLDEGMDTGPILTQVETLIEADETSGDLLTRLTSLGISSIDEVLAKIEAGIEIYSDQPTDGTYAGKISRDDAKINWRLDAHSIELLIRAMNPEPVAWTTFLGLPIRILQALEFHSEMPEENYAIGQVFESNRRIIVQAGHNTGLQLEIVQPAGKSSMPAADWYRGLNQTAVLGG